MGLDAGKAKKIILLWGLSSEHYNKDIFSTNCRGCFGHGGSRGQGMNSRQKAKHFKMLYEMTLPKKPTNGIEIKSNPLEHYKCVVLAKSKEEAIERIAQHFKDFILCNDALYKHGDEYEFSFWLKKED